MCLLDLMNQGVVTSTSLWFLQAAEDWYKTKGTMQVFAWVFHVTLCFPSDSAAMLWRLAGCSAWSLSLCSSWFQDEISLST